MLRPPVMARTVVLGEQHDDDGLWMRSVTLDDEGDLVIEGHDLGPGVERLMGAGLREYEFVRTVRAADVPPVVQALGLAEAVDVLDALVDRYAGLGVSRSMRKTLPRMLDLTRRPR